MNRIMIVLIIVFGLWFVGCSCDGQKKGPSPAESAKKSPKQPSQKAAPSADDRKNPIQLISKGEKVDIKKHLEAGKYTVVDFYADWCPGCRQLAPQLEAAIKKNTDLVLRKINIMSWQTPVVSQYGIQGIPYLMVYDPLGKLIAKGEEAQHMVLHWEHRSK